MALGYVGQNGVNACSDTVYGTAYPGECKQFVNCIIFRASGGAQRPGGGNDYFGSFLAAGGVEVSEAAAVKGDIVQWGSGLTSRQHTAIVVENRGGGSFRLVDSNSRYDKIVRDHVDNVRTYVAGQSPRFARMANAGAPPLPPPPPDTDGDGVADSSDSCPQTPGFTWLVGCRDEEWSAAAPNRDFNGDGRSDYCRRVGGVNLKESYIACTLGASDGFGATYGSGVVDWGYDLGRSWVDFSGDGRADFCRVVGISSDQHVRCLMSSGTGFGADVASPALDWGYGTGRAWTDMNGDAKADYCRRVGNTNGADSRVSCTLSTGTSFGSTITSPVADWGYEAGRAWTDFSGDGRADYCRVVGIASDQHVRCLISTATGFSADVLSPNLDWGYASGRVWTDVNGDGRSDFCRRVGNTNNTDSRVSCTLSTGSGFGATITSGVVDWGYEAGQSWADFSGDGRADYCRVVGIPNDQHVRCLISTGSGFGADVLSPNLDWGYGPGRFWSDANGDGRADYCRRVGNVNNQDSRMACTLSGGTAFGSTVSSPVLDWGYDTGRTMAGPQGARPTVTISPSTTITYGSSKSLTGSLKTASGTGLFGRSVRVLAKPYGAASYSTVGTVTTNASGGYSLSVRPSKTTSYYASFAGGPSMMGRNSATVSVTVKQSVSLALNDATATRTQTVYFSGSVAPTGSGQTVYLQRYASGVWSNVKSMALSSTSGYKFAWKPTSSVDYSFRVYRPAKTGYAAGYSVTKKLVVA